MGEAKLITSTFLEFSLMVWNGITIPSKETQLKSLMSNHTCKHIPNLAEHMSHDILNYYRILYIERKQNSLIMSILLRSTGSFREA